MQSHTGSGALWFTPSKSFVILKSSSLDKVSSNTVHLAREIWGECFVLLFDEMDMNLLLRMLK